jgi:hypothetical protein
MVEAKKWSDSSNVGECLVFVCVELAGRWFSPGTPISSTNETNLHDITEILLKVALNTTTLSHR